MVHYSKAQQLARLGKKRQQRETGKRYASGLKIRLRQVEEILEIQEGETSLPATSKDLSAYAECIELNEILVSTQQNGFVCCNLADATHPSFTRPPVPYMLPHAHTNPNSCQAAVDAVGEVLDKAIKPVLLAGVGWWEGGDSATVAEFNLA
eukprot:scaffold195036_cov16-Tisochrysis_lutea.AAC.1